MKYFRYFLFAIMAVLILTTCDEVEAPYLIPVGGSDTADCPLPEFPHVHTPVKRVLLEDYTGHTCVNCPSAAVIAHDMEASLGDQLVVIAIHAGFFAMPLGGDFTTDFRTDAGTAWDGLFGISKVGNPNGMVDRVGYNSSHILSPGAWSGKVNQQLLKEPEVVIELINEYSQEGHKLCIHSQVVFVEETDKNLSICIVIVEDEIIAPQKNNDTDIGPTPDIMDYEHNNVLRGAVNSPWGVSITAKGNVMPVDSQVTLSYKYILNESWDPYKCRVVAFVYDRDTYEVLQANQAPAQ